MEKQFARTMGNIIRQVENLPEMSNNLKDRIVSAKKRRNFLTHHFWRERSREFATANKGRAEMRDELKKDRDEFEQLDRDINEALRPARKRLGIEDKMI
jgi:hypothetical protein